MKKINLISLAVVLISGLIFLTSAYALFDPENAPEEEVLLFHGEDQQEIINRTPSDEITELEPDTIPSPQKDIIDYVSGQIIVRYHITEANLQTPKGSEILQEHSEVVNAISEAYGLNITKYKAVHEYLVQQMVKLNKTEPEIKSKSYVRRLEKRNKAIPPVIELTDYGLSRILVLTLGDSTTDIFDIIEQLDGTNIYIQGAEVTLDVGPNYLATITFVPDDPLYPQQWAHQNTEAELGWDIERGNPDVIIAIVDTGAAYNHPDLADNIPLGMGYDFVDIDTAAYQASGWTLIPEEDYTVPDADPSDYYGHGTHCAGIAAAVANNAIGVAGVSHSCTIMPARAGFSILYYGTEYGILEYDDVANAISYAVLNGADIISMSFGGPSSSIMASALDSAYEQGVLLVAAAGNSNAYASPPNYIYPAAYDNVMAIAATDSNDVKASFSNYGEWIDVTAPGVGILSTVPTIGGACHNPSGYLTLSGTSMSAPYAAGLAGLILSHYPERSNNEVWGTIITTADDISSINTNYYVSLLGTGRVNNYNALTTPMTPNIMLTEKVFDDSLGNNNCIIEPGETASLVVTLENTWQDVSDVSAILTTTTPGVTILQPEANFGDINFREVKDNSQTPYLFTIDESVSTVLFNLQITASNYNNIITFEFIPLINVPEDFPTIQEAINASTDGSTILVQPGTYYENINFDGKEILVGSLFVTTANSAYIDSTIIDGNNQTSSVVTFNQREGPAAILKGFTITNANAIYGGGIHCWHASSPTLKNLTISGNTAIMKGGGIYYYYSNSTLENVTISGNTDAMYGGGIYCRASSLTLENVTISGNTATQTGGGIYYYYSNSTLENVTISDNTAAFYGGGIYCKNSSPTLENVTISGNTITTGYEKHGGGIYCENFSSPALKNVTISGNTANWGGGIYCYYYSNPTLENVTISGNTALYGGGIYYCNTSNPTLQNVTISGNTAYNGGGIYCGGGPITIKNSILWGNTPVQGSATPPGQTTYSNIEAEGGSIWAGVGNINTDPLFVNSAQYDYHLQLTSPCIDAGDPDPIYNDPEDPNNPGMALYPALGTVRNDMGAYGGSPGIIVPPPPPTTRIVPTEYPTIQAAINAANPGDTVLVLPGTYYIDDQIEVYKDLTIKSEQGPENTTLLATTSLSGSEYVFLIMTGTTSDTTIEGFTINPATPNSTSWNGFGCQTGTAPTIQNNAIQEGGVFGIYATSASPLTKNNVISGFNYGIKLTGVSLVGIVNCTIVYNTNAGLTIYDGAQVTSLKNSIVYGNNSSASCPSGLGNFCGYTTPISVTYSDIGGSSVYPGIGNINADPLFVDPENDDYHLQLGSPCIDAGDPNPIYNDPEDPNNPGMALYPALGTVRNDMGAYGGPDLQTPPVVVIPSITITNPIEGQIINLSTEQAIIWNTSMAILPSTNLRLVIIDLRKDKTVLDTLIENTGSHSLPSNILETNTTYNLELSCDEQEPPISDSVKFETSEAEPILIFQQMQMP